MVPPSHHSGVGQQGSHSALCSSMGRRWWRSCSLYNITPSKNLPHKISKEVNCFILDVGETFEIFALWLHSHLTLVPNIFHIFVLLQLFYALNYFYFITFSNGRKKMSLSFLRLTFIEYSSSPWLVL